MSARGFRYTLLLNQEGDWEIVQFVSWWGDYRLQDLRNPVKQAQQEPTSIPGLFTNHWEGQGKALGSRLNRSRPVFLFKGRTIRKVMGLLEFFSLWTGGARIFCGLSTFFLMSQEVAQIFSLIFAYRNFFFAPRPPYHFLMVRPQDKTERFTLTRFFKK